MSRKTIPFTDNDLCSVCGAHFDTEPHAADCSADRLSPQEYRLAPYPSREEMQRLRERAGFITARRNRLTGDVNSLYDGEAAGMDTKGGRWQTVCEVHGSICSHTSRKVALAHLNTADWCEACTDTL